MFSRQCSAHDRQLLRLLLAARCDELERRLALIEGELFLAAPDHPRSPAATRSAGSTPAVGPEATEDLLPQFHHPTIAFREVVGEGHTQLPPPGCIATFFLRIALMKQFEPNIREEEAFQETL